MTKGNIALWDLRDKWNMRELRKIWTKWRNEQEQKNVTYAGMRGNGYVNFHQPILQTTIDITVLSSIYYSDNRKQI